ncbi:MAG: hypothetical protein MK207_06245 [Saprospiraceae bacterium]|nr:hypothetical protein [Saprospiraceae bacterium]
MKKKQTINLLVKAQMGQEWSIEIDKKPFTEGEGGNMPSLGYPCGFCGSKETKLRFAKSTEEELSSLEWMELQCKSCKSYTLYTKK